MKSASWMIFFLLVLLVAAVYYIGVSSDLLAGAKAGQILGFTVTGRNAQGQFGTYPNSPANVYQPTF